MISPFLDPRGLVLRYILRSFISLIYNTNGDTFFGINLGTKGILPMDKGFNGLINSSSERGRILASMDQDLKCLLRKFWSLKKYVEIRRV